MIAPNCSHECLSDCRREGCNCLCGESHDHYDPSEDEADKLDEIKND